jgi:hypothetical protein
VLKSVLRQRGEEAALIVTAHMEQGKAVPLAFAPAKGVASFGLTTAASKGWRM